MIQNVYLHILHSFKCCQKFTKDTHAQNKVHASPRIQSQTDVILDQLQRGIQHLELIQIRLMTQQTLLLVEHVTSTNSKVLIQSRSI